MEIEHVEGADMILDRAGPLLAANEARHNLAFGILATARAHPDVYPEAYTDLANPTSNAIYMRIGYERVCESREIAFVR